MTLPICRLENFTPEQQAQLIEAIIARWASVNNWKRGTGSRIPCRASLNCQHALDVGHHRRSSRCQYDLAQAILIKTGS